MGQRVNYIIKDSGKLITHYNHWRANSIASDLYLGEKRFLEFVNECQLNDELIHEPWIEGCVIIDRKNKELYFWSFEFFRDTSVVDYYLQQLSKKWEGWELQILKNRMYDAEKVLDIDYISKQEIQKINIISKEEIVADKVDEWVSTLIIIKNGSDIFITKTGNINIEDIISYGKDVIPLLKDKTMCDLPREGEEGTYQCIVIDEEKRKVIINESSISLWKFSKDIWPDFNIIVGDFGYIETLRLAGFETFDKELSGEEIRKQFDEMIQINNSFDPIKLAERITQDNKGVQFNSDFFDNIKPRMSLVEKLKTEIRNLLGKK